MPALIILGSSNAVPDESHENTHMAVVGRERTLLIDCVSTPVVRLRQAGIALESIRDLILTHFHPDHVSGVPSLLMSLWLLGRKTPLDIYGLAPTLDRVEKLMAFYDWASWPNFFTVRFHRLPPQEATLVLETDEFRVLASPVRHLVPTIGLRIEFPPSGKVLAYSCDTQPCQEVVRLAAGADVLLHEAAGGGIGHSSAAQAGQVAREAGARALYLIHYPTGGFDPSPLIAEAQKAYEGPVSLATDFMRLEF
jgi:ribonuclease Z